MPCLCCIWPFLPLVPLVCLTHNIYWGGICCTLKLKPLLHLPAQALSLDAERGCCPYVCPPLCGYWTPPHSLSVPAFKVTANWLKWRPLLIVLGQDPSLAILALEMEVECTEVRPKEWDKELWWVTAIQMSMYYSPSPRETLMWLLHKSCPSRRKWNPILISRPRQGSFWGMLTVGGHCSYRTWTRCWQRSFLSPWISAAALGQTSLQERTECEPGVQWTPWGEDHVIEPPRSIDRERLLNKLCLWKSLPDYPSVTDSMSSLAWLGILNYWKNFRILAESLSQVWWRELKVIYCLNLTCS